MASLIALAGGALINALAFSGTNYMFSHLDKKMQMKNEYDTTRRLKNLIRQTLSGQKERTKKLDFYNKYLKDQQEAYSYIANINDAAEEYYQATGQKQELTPKHTLSELYHPSEIKNQGKSSLSWVASRY